MEEEIQLLKDKITELETKLYEVNKTACLLSEGIKKLNTDSSFEDELHIKWTRASITKACNIIDEIVKYTSGYINDDILIRKVSTVLNMSSKLRQLVFQKERL